MTKAEAIAYLQPIADSASLKRYSEALNMAIDALKQQPDGDGWIKVEDGPPDTQDDVLVCTQSKNGSRNIDKGYWSNDRYVHRGTAAVTHWRPLPPLPAGGEHNGD